MSSRLTLVSHDESGAEVRVALRSGLVLGRTTTPHLALNTRVSRAAVFIERVDRVRRELHIMAVVHGRHVVVMRESGEMCQVATAARAVLQLGDSFALLVDPVFNRHAPHVFQLLCVRDDSDNGDVSDSDDAAISSVISPVLPANKRRRTAATSAGVPTVDQEVAEAAPIDSIALSSSSVPAAAAAAVVEHVIDAPQQTTRSHDALEADDERSLELLAATVDPLREAMRAASFATLPLDADPADAFEPSFVPTVNQSDPRASFVRAEPVSHVDNEQQIVCGRRVLLSGSFGSTRALFGASAGAGVPPMTLCAVDCTVCGRLWCAHVARLFQRLALHQLSASVTPSGFDFLAGRPRKRRQTPLLQKKPELQPMLDRLFGDCDNTLDESQLSEVARFIDGDRSVGASSSGVPLRRVGPVVLDYEHGGWRLHGESELLAVGNAGGELVERYAVTQAFVRGSSAFFALSRKLDNIVVRCSISAALGPAGVFGFRCECASAGVLCEHVCRVLTCASVPPIVDIGALFCSLSKMTLTEHCGLLARIIMRAKTNGVDRALVVPLNRVASTTTTVRVNTGALPNWSVAEAGDSPTVLIASQAGDAGGDLLVATLTQAYRAVSLRIRRERVVGAHCDECGSCACKHVHKAMRDFVFYARGGFGGIPVHAVVTLESGFLLSYDEIVSTLSQCSLARRVELVALAMRHVRQIQSPNVAKRCAQLFSAIETVDESFPSRAMFEMRDFAASMEALAVVEHICSSAAYLDALCVVSFNFPKHSSELESRWTAFVERAEGDEIFQCMHAGRALSPRQLGVKIVKAALMRVTSHSGARLDESASRAFIAALYGTGGADAVEAASHQLLAVPEAVCARAPFELVANIDTIDPIGAARQDITPLYEAAVFLLPSKSVDSTLDNRGELVRGYHAPLSSSISPADVAALAVRRGGMSTPSFAMQEMSALVEACPMYGGVLPLLMLFDLSLRHARAECRFLVRLRLELFDYALAHLHCAFDDAPVSETDLGALREVPPLASMSLDAMAASMADAAHYTGAEVRDIVQATPTVLRKSLLLRILISRVALCSPELARLCASGLFAWAAEHKLHSLQAMAYLAIGKFFEPAVRDKVASVLVGAFEADGKRAISQRFLRALMTAVPTIAEIVVSQLPRIGQGAMLLEHLLATPARWHELDAALGADDADDDAARAMLRSRGVQRQLSALVSAASAGTFPPATFLARVCELQPESSNSCALLLARAPDATDEHRRSAMYDLLAQTYDDDTVLAQLCALSHDEAVLLSQARVCEHAGRGRLAALIMVTTATSASRETRDLLAKLVTRDDFDLLEVLLDARAERFLDMALESCSPMLVERHAQSTSGLRRTFAVECFNRSIGASLRNAVRAATGASAEAAGCHNVRCTTCKHCVHLLFSMRRAMMWASLADRVWEFDRTRSSVASELTDHRKQKLTNIIGSIRNDVELTLMEEDE